MRGGPGAAEAYPAPAGTRGPGGPRGQESAVGLAICIAALLAAAGCELTETTVADPEPVVLAEVMLRAGAPRQYAYLHRTFAGDSVGGGPVPGARIEVSDADERTLHFQPADSTDCFLLRPYAPVDRLGTCYYAPSAGGGDAGRPTIVPGAEYTLRIELPDGGVLEGATVVPDAFEWVRPPSSCTLRPDTTLDIVWTAADDAWLYVAEAELTGLDDLFTEHGHDPPSDPVTLGGLAASRTDTTITFPTEFGLFERFDLPREVLLAVRDGLPAGVGGRVTVAAVDRNYVNWARGGNFHPSGRTRIPSIRGDGTGVFAATAPRTFEFHVDVAADRGQPLCSADPTAGGLRAADRRTPDLGRGEPAP